MMTFVPIDKLKPSMILARDVYGFDKFTSQMMLLRAGQPISEKSAAKLRAMGHLGVYILSSESIETDDSSVKINKETRQEVFSNIRLIYDLSLKAPDTLSVESVREANTMLEKMIDTIDSKQVPLDISNLRLYDDYTYNHSLSVTILTIAIGIAMRFNRKDLSELSLAALLHDIGKMSIPIEIISKPGRLTPEEFTTVKEHVIRGGMLLKEQNVVNERVYAGVISHHERVDGKGYPRALSGDNIPLFGRIISCADVYDALTSNRPYRIPSTPSEALEYIMGGIGQQFDFNVVQSFIKCISPYPVGMCVSLSNGEDAIVTEQNPSYPLRPVVRLMNAPFTEINLCTDPKGYSIVINSICQK